MFRTTAKPIHAKTGLKHTERGTKHCSNGRPTVVCEPYRPNRKDSLVSVATITHSSSMKGPRLNFHAERDLAGHLLAVCWYHELFAPGSNCLRLVVNRQARLPTLHSRNSTTNSSSTHQPTAAAPTSQQHHSKSTRVYITPGNCVANPSSPCAPLASKRLRKAVVPWVGFI